MYPVGPVGGGFPKDWFHNVREQMLVQDENEGKHLLDEAEQVDDEDDDERVDTLGVDVVEPEHDDHVADEERAVDVSASSDLAKEKGKEGEGRRSSSVRRANKY